LRFPGAPDSASLRAAAAARGIPYDEAFIDDAETAALYERKLVLVRPDGHVAWRGDAIPADPAATSAAPPAGIDGWNTRHFAGQGGLPKSQPALNAFDRPAAMARFSVGPTAARYRSGFATPRWQWHPEDCCLRPASPAPRNNLRGPAATPS